MYNKSYSFIRDLLWGSNNGLKPVLKNGKKNLQKKEQCRMNERGRKTSMNKIWLIKIFSIFTSMCYCSNNHRLGRILSSKTSLPV